MVGSSVAADPSATRSRRLFGIGAHEFGPTVAGGPDSPPSYPRVRPHECVALATLALTQPLVDKELGRSVHVPAPVIKCNFYIEFYE